MPNHNFHDAYASGDIPWNYAHATPDLVDALNKGQLKGATALDIGCGTGSDSIEFARRGITVTAVDLVPRAVQTARARSIEAGQLGRINHIIGDILETDLGGPYDILYDRGIYHFMRHGNLEKFLAALKRLSHPGTRWLSLSGNAKEHAEFGPPRVHDYEIRADLGGLFEILELRETHFVTDDSSFKPLAWATLMERRI